MLYSRPDAPRNGLPSCVFRTSRRDSGHASVFRGKAAVSRCHRVLPHGGFLRDVLRGRADRRARPRADADVTVQGLDRGRHSHVRGAPPRRRRLHRPSREERIPCRRLRADGRSAEGKGTRSTRSGACRFSGHPHRRRLSRRAGARVPDGHRSSVGRAGIRRGASRPFNRRIHDDRVRGKRRAPGARRRVGGAQATRNPDARRPR